MHSLQRNCLNNFDGDRGTYVKNLMIENQKYIYFIKIESNKKTNYPLIVVIMLIWNYPLMVIALVDSRVPNGVDVF